MVVVGANLASVLLVVVLVGLDEVVRLAVARVEVRVVLGLGELIALAAFLLGSSLSGSLVVAHVGLFLTVLRALLAVAGAVATVATVGLAVTGLGLLDVTGRGGGAVGGRTVIGVVLSPGISTPLIVIFVVPLIVGLGIVGLSPCLLVRLLNTQVLIAAVGAVIVTVLVAHALGTLSGGSVVNALAAFTVAVAVTLLFGPLGSSGAVSLRIVIGVAVVVLSPLIITSIEGPAVLGAVVRPGRDGVVRLAPPGVGISTVLLVGPLGVIGSTARCSVTSGGTLPVLGLIGVTTFTVVVAGPLVSGGLLAVGRLSIDIFVAAPLLGTPLVGILVVPLIVGLGIVGLGLSGVEGDGLFEVLIPTIGIPLVLGLAPLLSALVLRGVLVVSILAVSLAAVVVTSGGRSGSGAAVGINLTGLVVALVLSPLVVVGTDGALVVLVVVRLGRDSVVGLAPPGVFVLTVVLLSPLVVIVSGVLGSLLPRGRVLRCALLGFTTVSLGTVAGLTVALVVSIAVAVLLDLVGLAAISELLLIVISGGGISLLGGGTVVVGVLAPLLGTVLVVILVVPFIVGLGAVLVSTGLAVRFVDGKVLISAIGIEAVVLRFLLVLTVALGCLFVLLGRLDLLGDRLVLNLAVATAGAVAGVSAVAGVNLTVATVALGPGRS